MNVSGYIMCLDEERSIEAAVRNLAQFVDHILILDCGSTDGTMSILERLQSELPITLVQRKQAGARFSNEWNEPYQRNWCIENCKYDWILTIDADELIDDGDVNYFRNHQHAMFFNRINVLNRTEYILRVKIGDAWKQWWPDKTLRYFHRSHGRYNNQPLHCCLYKDPDTPNARLVFLDSKESPLLLWHLNALVKDGRKRFFDLPCGQDRICGKLRRPFPKHMSLVKCL